MADGWRLPVYRRFHRALQPGSTAVESRRALPERRARRRAEPEPNPGVEFHARIRRVHRGCEPEAGADHLDFKLSPLQGQIALYSADLSLIDCVVYGPQTTDISQGRQPSGTDNFAFFSTLTPGAPNPVLSVTVTVSNTVVNLFGVTDKLWSYDNSGADLGTAWRAPSYNDSSWQAGFGRFGFETTPGVYPYPFQTTIPAPNQAGGQVTVYYRTHF